MSPTPTVTYTTPDGVERALRFTLGARKRIAERFNEPDITAILNRFGDGALPDIAHAMMYDQQGKPPDGLSAAAFAEALDDEAGPGLMAAIMSAISKGKASKNELEAMLTKMRQEASEKLIGSLSGASRGSASESQPMNSGTAPSESSTLSSSDSGNPSAPPTIGPA